MNSGEGEALKRSLGRTIVELRKRNGLTQAELAARLQIHQSMVTRWEKGQALPRSHNIERLAQALEVPVDELLVRKNRPIDGDPSPGTSGDLEFSELFDQLDQLSERDRQALKAVMEAMLTRARMENLIRPRSA